MTKEQESSEDEALREKKRRAKTEEKQWNSKGYKFFGLNPCNFEPKPLFMPRKEVGCPPICEMDKCNYPRYKSSQKP